MVETLFDDIVYGRSLRLKTVGRIILLAMGLELVFGSVSMTEPQRGKEANNCRLRVRPLVANSCHMHKGVPMATKTEAFEQKSNKSGGRWWVHG